MEEALRGALGKNLARVFIEEKSFSQQRFLDALPTKIAHEGEILRRSASNEALRRVLGRCSGSRSSRCAPGRGGTHRPIGIDRERREERGERREERERERERERASEREREREREKKRKEERDERERERERQREGSQNNKESIVWV